MDDLNDLRPASNKNSKTRKKRRRQHNSDEMDAESMYDLTKDGTSLSSPDWK